MKRFNKWVSALAMVFVTVNVQAIPLEELLDGASMTSGDKVFDDWRLVDIPLDPIDLSAIDVMAVGDGTAGNEYGLRFTGNGELMTSGFNFLDLFFEYSVTAGPGMLINGAFMTGITDAAGDWGITVLKEVFDAADDLLASMQIEDDSFFGVDLDDEMGFAAASTILIQDNILVFSDDEFGDANAELIEFTQRFSQIPTAVPAPGTIALFALGLLGLAGLRRRQAQ